MGPSQIWLMSFLLVNLEFSRFWTAIKRSMWGGGNVPETISISAHSHFFLMPGTVPLFGLVPHAERLMFSSAATGGYQHRPWRSNLVSWLCLLATCITLYGKPRSLINQSTLILGWHERDILTNKTILLQSLIQPLVKPIRSI